MAYTETKTEKWSSRMGSSFSGILVGLVLFAVGTALLWWNEGDFVGNRDALKEAQSVVEELADLTVINPSMNGKLIHATGFADTQDELVDPVFGIKEKAIALGRTVQYYQWTEQAHEERHEKVGGDVEVVITYSYSKKWVRSPVNSAGFHDPAARTSYNNTVLMAVDDFEAWAPNVTLGAYHLPDSLIRHIGGVVPLKVQLDEEKRTELTQEILASRRDHSTNNSFLQQIGASSSSHPVQYVSNENSNTIYIGSSPSLPHVGDVRVSFKSIMPADVSIISKVNGDTFEPFYASNGKAVNQLSMGKLSMEHMFGSAHSANSTFTWLFRGLGIVLVILGLKTIIAPLSVLASVIPFLGSIVGAGTGFVAALLGLAWSLIVIAVAWLRFRPVIGGIILVLAVGIFLLLFIKGRKGKDFINTNNG